VFADLLCESQIFIRRIEEPYSVSLRDVKRAIKLAAFFSKSLKDRPPANKYSVYPPEGGIQISTRCYILSLGLCYQARIYDKETRKRYRNEMKIIFKRHGINIDEEKFNKVIREEQEDYVGRMTCPPNTALNEALLENVLVMAVCIQTKIPVFIIGAPGSSKSLAVRLVSQNLRGSDSSDPFFKTLPQVYLIPHQGSSSSTSDGIIKVFQKAEAYQKTGSDDFSVTSVVLLDEVGLAEKSPFNPLKVLHALLEPRYPSDGPSVSVIGISNWRLDNSKSSRALLVQRPKFDLDDLVDTAVRLLKEETWTTKELLKPLAKAYYDYEQHGQEIANFHGLRDYYALVKSLSVDKLTPRNIQKALFRNFGGTSKTVELCDKHFREVLTSFNDYKLWECTPIPIDDLISTNLNEKGARHLMIIGKSDSILNLLSYQMKKSNLDPIIILGSQFPDDQEDYSYSVLSRIMIMKISDILSDYEEETVSQLEAWAKQMVGIPNPDPNSRFTLKDLFIGFDPDETLQSLVIDVSRNDSDDDRSVILEKCKEKLIAIASSDGIVRAEKSILSMDERTHWKNIYFNAQHHDSMAEYFRDLFNNETAKKKSPDGFQVDKLSTFKTESQLQNRIKHFWHESAERLLVLQCDVTTVNAGCIKLTKFIIEQLRNEFLTKRTPTAPFNFMCGWDQVTIETLARQKKSPSSLLEGNLCEVINTIYKFEDILEQELPWCLSCMKYPSNSRAVEHIKIISSQILNHPRLIELIKTRVQSWLGEKTSEDWQFKVASDKKLLYRYSSFSTALQAYIRSFVRIPIAKMLYALERVSVTRTFFTLNAVEMNDPPEVDNSDPIPMDVNRSIELEQIDDAVEHVNCPMEASEYKLMDVHASTELEQFDDAVEGADDSMETSVSNLADVYVPIELGQRDDKIECLDDLMEESASNSMDVHTSIEIEQTEFKESDSADERDNNMLIESENLGDLLNSDLAKILQEFWVRMFNEEKLINIKELQEPQPDKYDMPSGIYDLKFPFSYYFMEQIDSYRAVYTEEISTLKDDPKSDQYTIDSYITDFTRKVVSLIPIFKSSPISQASLLYFKDFVSVVAYSEFGDRDLKVLESILRKQLGPEKIRNPVFLHIYWWENQNSILTQLQLAQMVPSSIQKLKGKKANMAIDYSTHLMDEVVQFMLHDISDPSRGPAFQKYEIDRWRHKATKIISIGKKITGSLEMSSFQTLLACDDLLSTAAFARSEIMRIVNLGLSMRNCNEVLSSEFVHSILELLTGLPKTEKNLNPKRSFILRCLNTIPIESSARLTLYKTLFTQEPFPLMGAIITEIFKAEDNEIKNIFFSIIDFPSRELSPRLHVIDNCIENAGLNSSMTVLCCDTIQQEFFSGYSLRSMTPHLHKALETLYGHGMRPVKKITSIAFLKEFAHLLWDHVLINDRFQVRDLYRDRFLQDIDDYMSLAHPLIRSLKIYLIRILRDKGKSMNEIKQICDNQRLWFADLSWEANDNNLLPFNPYFAINDYVKFEMALRDFQDRAYKTPLKNLIGNRRIDKNKVRAMKQNDQAGYIREPIDKSQDYTVRSMPPVSYRILHFIVHVLIASSLPSNETKKFLGKSNEYDSEIEKYCVDHIKNDWEVLKKILNATDENLALLIISILNEMSEKPSAQFPKDLRTPEDRIKWETKFTEIYVNPRIHSIVETANIFRMRLDQAMKSANIIGNLIEGEINQSLAMDEDYCNEHLPRLWRTIGRIDFQSFRAYYTGNLRQHQEDFPFLAVYFEHSEKLALIKHLYPIVRFVRILNSRLAYQLTRKEATRLSFEDFISEESQNGDLKDVHGTLLEAFEKFSESWNTIIEYVNKYHCHEFKEEKPKVDLKKHVVLGLVEGRDVGIYLCAILEFLINLQNNFLQDVLSIPNANESLKFWRTQTSEGERELYIESRKLDCLQENNFINYEWNNSILQHSQRNLGMKFGHDVVFDLQRIEAELALQLLSEKIYIDGGGEQRLYMDPFPYHMELIQNSVRILNDISDILPQEPIPSDKALVIIGSPVNMHQNPTSVNYHMDNASEMFSFLEVLICFIKRTSSNDSEMLINDFVHRWIKLSNLIEHKEYNNILGIGLKLKHVVALYELIEDQVANTTIRYLPQDLRIPLDEDLKEAIEKTLDFDQKMIRFPADAFAIALKRFMQRFLSVENNNLDHALNTYLADMTLNLWPANIDEQLVDDTFSYSFYDLLVKHSYSAYIFVIDKIEKSRKKNSEARRPSHKRNPRFSARKENHYNYDAFNVTPQYMSSTPSTSLSESSSSSLSSSRISKGKRKERIFDQM
ncbi:11270_t:CDS:10, partial [Acaulospora colombiana]